MAAFDAMHWDERYRGTELVWGAGPNQFVRRECAALTPGRAIDLACGEGRNAIWLAGRGWRVTGVDFAQVALDKAVTLAAGVDGVDWVCADVLTYRPDEPIDLVLLSYLQVSGPERAQVLANSVADLVPGGVVLLVSHDLTNLADGYGGPKDAAVLSTPVEVAGMLESSGLVVDKAEVVTRVVDGADRPALDTLVRAHRPI
jgi:SAM-dependent methyltransferase